MKNKEYVLFVDGKYWGKHSSMRNARTEKKTIKKVLKNAEVTIYVHRDLG